MIQTASKEHAYSKSELVLAGLSLFVILYYFAFYAVFPENGGAAPFTWLWNCWNGERLDYAHGKLIPFAMGVVIWKRRHEIASALYAPRWWGLLLVIFGILFYLASVRTLQPRVALGGLPVLLLGAAVFLRGTALAKILFFPVILFYFGIPVPGLTQATNGLQVFATKGAYEIVSFLGVESIVSGNYINSPTDAWGFDIAEGCSGIRSLIALMLVSVMYGYFVHKERWKRFVLFLASMPIAIIANTLRVASIVLIAEYASPEFAGGIYHDYSGFVFFPFGLLGMLIVSGLMKVTESYVVRKTVVSGVDSSETPS